MQTTIERSRHTDTQTLKSLFFIYSFFFFSTDLLLLQNPVATICIVLLYLLQLQKFLFLEKQQKPSKKNHIFTTN